MLYDEADRYERIWIFLAKRYHTASKIYVTELFELHLASMPAKSLEGGHDGSSKGRLPAYAPQHLKRIVAEVTTKTFQ